MINFYTWPHCRPCLAAFLVAFAWALSFHSTRAGGMLLVSSPYSTNVGEYNANTGALIKADFITPAPGGHYMAVDANNHLFVSSGGLSTSSIAEYNATTGAAIGVPFITATQGLNRPLGLAVDSNHHLFVVNYNAATVGKYDATTGATVAAQFVNDNQGLNLPQSAALDSLNNHLFVYDTVNGWVSEFDATTGATVKFHFANYGAPALLVDGHNHLFVANPAASTPSVMEFDATTGAIINANFISAISAFGLALDDNNHLFVSDNSLGTIGEYDATTGAPINANFITGLGTGLSGPWAVVFVKPVISGDFNANGTVDSADYILWRKGLGTTYTQSDYDVWRAHFGQTSGPGSGVSANVSVPEPATLMMLLTGVPAMCSRRRAKVS